METCHSILLFQIKSHLWNQLSYFCHQYHSNQVLGPTKLLQTKIAKEFKERMVAWAKNIKVSDPLEEGCRLGPVVSKGQVRRVNFVEIQTSYHLTTKFCGFFLIWQFGTSGLVCTLLSLLVSTGCSFFPFWEEQCSKALTDMIFFRFTLL